MTDLAGRIVSFRERNADALHALEAHDPFPWHPEGDARQMVRTSVQVRLMPEYGGLYVLDPRFGTCQEPECYSGTAQPAARRTQEGPEE